MRQRSLDQCPVSGLRQSLLEVLYDVVNVFDSDRKSDEAVSQAPFPSIPQQERRRGSSSPGV